MELDFSAYVARQKAGVTGERGEGYAYEGDLKVLRAMRKLKPVELAVAQTVKLSKSVVTGDLLGSAVKVGPAQFPRIHAITARCAKTLGIPVPQVYIVPRMDSFNAMTFGTDDDAFIMVHALLAEQFTDAELSFVIGHECGHIQNNHVVYLTTLYRIQQLLQLTAGLLAPLLMPAQLALQSWARAAEITCDRAGLLCCRDPEVAVRSFARLAIGSSRLFAEMNVDAYLDQLKEGREGIGRVGELTKTHPYVTKRIEALRLFADSALYHGAIGADGGMARDELERKTEELIKVL